MNKPGWVQKHWYDLRLAHQQPKAGARSRQTVVSVSVQGRGWHRRNAAGSVGPWWGVKTPHTD